MKTYEIPRVAWLASEDNPDPVTRAQYRELADLPFDTTLQARPLPVPAENEVAQERPTVDESLGLLTAARRCPHRERPACSCTFAHCSRDGRDKAASECLECIRQAQPGDR